MGTAGIFYSLQWLIVLRWNIPDNIFDLTLQNPAKVIDSRCIERFVFSEFVNGGTGNMMVCNQRVRALF